MSSQTRIKPGCPGSIQKPLNTPTAITSSCATSSPAGPAWLEPCGHVITAPRRRHHRQPRHRAAGEHRAPPGSPPGDVRRGEHHRPRPPDGDFPGRGRHLPPGGNPLRAPVGEGPPRLERGERDRHARRARRGEGLRGAGRGWRLLGLRRHPGSGVMAGPTRR